jgi:hypothetical protein
MDELYFEEGYVEVGYFAKTLIGAASLASSSSVSFDGDIADTSGYYIPDYIDVGYYENGVIVTGSGTLSSSASFTVTATKVIQGTATITDAFSSTMTVNAIRFVDSLMEIVSTFTSTANKTVDPGATLENIANLNAQADKVFGFAAAAAAEFTLTADVFNVQLADSNMSSDFALSANAISYIRKSNLPSSTTGRPWATSYISQNIATEEAPAFDAVTKKFGSHSLRFHQDDGGVNPTQNSYVKYYSNGDVARMPQLGQALHIEFWVRNTGQFIDAREGNTSRWRINSSNFSIIGGPTIGISLTAGQFNHVVIKAQPSNIKIYVNGSLAGSSTQSFPADGIDNIVFGDDDLYSTNFTDGFFYLDEFRIIRGLIDDVDADVGYTIAASSITEPTQEFDSTANTKILLHWNNSYVDDLYGVQVASSSLASQFNQVTAANQQVLSNAGLASEFTIITTSAIIRIANATINSEFTQSITPNYLRPGEAVLSSSFAVTAEPSIIKTSAVSLSSEFAQTSTAAKTVDPDIEFAALASQLTAVAKIGDFLIAADVIASLSADVNAVFVESATLNSEFTQTANAIKSVTGQGSFASEFTATTDSVKTVNIISTQTATANINVDAVKNTSGVIALNATADLSADPAGTIIRIVGDLSSEATLAVSVIRIQQGNAQLTDEFQLSAAPIAAIVGSADLSCETALNVDTDRFRDADIEMPAVASQLAAAVKIGDFFINADVQATLTIDATILAAGSVAIESIATTSTVAQKITDINSNQTATATLSAEGTSNIVGEGTLITVANLTADSAIIATISAAFNSSFAQISQAVKNAQGISAQSATTQQITVADRTRNYNSNLNSQFAIVAGAGIIVSASANLPSITSSLIFARELRIDQYVYLIPSESRTHSIQRETRSHTIRYETRTHAIEGT